MSVTCIQVTRVVPIQGGSELLLRHLVEGDGSVVVFTSPRTLSLLLEDAGPAKGEAILEELRNRVIAAIGPSTRESLRRHGLDARIMPRAYDTRELAYSLVGFLAGKPGEEGVIHPCSLQSLPLLGEVLRAHSIPYKPIPVYQHLPDPDGMGEFLRLLEEGRVDAVGITSPVIARLVCALSPERVLRGLVVGVLGGATREVFLRECGGLSPNIIVPPANTVASLLGEISRKC